VYCVVKTYTCGHQQPLSLLSNSTVASGSIISGQQLPSEAGGLQAAFVPVNMPCSLG